MHSKGVRSSMGMGVLIAGIVVGLSVLSIVGQAQPAAAISEPPEIDQATELEIIDSITTTLNDYYVFPEVAKGMESYVRNQFKDRAYEEVKRLDQFTMALTRDLQQVSAAYQHALEQMLNAASEMQPDIEWALIGLKAKDGTPSLSESERLEYVGTYGPRNIAINNNELVYERMGTDNGPMRMMPLTEDVFGFEEIDWFRLKFERDDLGDVVAVVGMYENGQRERNPRGN